MQITAVMCTVENTTQKTFLYKLVMCNTRGESILQRTKMIFQQELFEIESRGKTEGSKKLSPPKPEGIMKSLLELTHFLSAFQPGIPTSIKLC